MNINGRRSAEFFFGITSTIGAAIFLNGCVPVLPPVASTTPKIGLYFEKTTSLVIDIENPSNGPSAPALIQRWLPATQQIDVLFQQTSESGLYGISSIQPFGSNFIVFKFTLPVQSTFVMVPDSNDRSLRLLHNSSGLLGGGGTATADVWTEWAPDGKHIGMSVDKEVIVSNADGSNKKTIGVISGYGQSPSASYSWSPNGKKLAYTTAPGTLEVVDVYSGQKVAIAAPAAEASIVELRWMADSVHLVGRATNGDNPSRTFVFDVNSPASTQEYNRENWYSPNVWSPDGDRFVESARAESGLRYVLSFIDNRPAVELLISQNDDAYAPYFLPAWSNGGEMLSYIKDVNGDGNAEVVVASKDGMMLHGYSGFPVPEDATLSWSPDNSKIFVVTNSFAERGGLTRGAIIHIDTGTVDNVFENEVPHDRAMKLVIDWSPNSRYVAFQTRSLNPFDAADVRLVDTSHVGSIVASFSSNDVEWSPDSKYLAISTPKDAEAADCALSVLEFKNDARFSTPVADSTSCRMMWSNPAANL